MLLAAKLFVTAGAAAFIIGAFEMNRVVTRTSHIRRLRVMS